MFRISHRWLDETPTGRIIARCTQDIRAVDGSIPQAVSSLIDMGITMVTKLVVIIIFTPIFLFPTMAFSMAGFYLGNLYLRAQLSVKREMRYAIAVLWLCFPFTYVIQQCTFPATGPLQCSYCGYRYGSSLVNST